MQFELPTDMKFTGSVVDTTPNWMWKIGASANMWAANWDINKSEGIEEKGKTTFLYNERNLKGRTAFVQGYTKYPAAKGGPGLAPIVTVMNATNAAIALNGNTIPQVIHIKASGRRHNGTTVSGIMSLTIESAVGVAYKKNGITSTWYTESNSGSIGWAAISLILENRGDFYENYGAATYIYQNIGYDISSVLRGDSVSDAHTIMGAFTSHLGKLKTSWEVVPNTWTATLIAQVRIV